MERESVVHTLNPVFNQNSCVLILGTMPSPKSRETGFYYNHPQNRFWPVMAAVLQEPVPITNDGKRDLLLRHRIALWDVLASCEIAGAGDASIRNPVSNDLTDIFLSAQIRAVFTTGKKAWTLYQNLLLPVTGREALLLPSPSAANAATGMNSLIAAYEKIIEYL